MTQLATNVVDCPDSECNSGIITVHDAYSKDPLTGREQPCDSCNGRGFVILSTDAELTN